MVKGQRRSILQSRWFILLSVAVLTLCLGMPQASAKQEKVLLDINTASEKELEGLKGVGPATAKKIIENRPYKSVDELSKAGLSGKTIESLKPFVTAGSAALPKAEPKPAPAAKSEPKPAPPAPAAQKPAVQPAPTKMAETVDLNSADQKALEALPGIGPATAQEIIKNRPYKSVDDLSRVKGLSKTKIDALRDKVTVAAPKGMPSAAPAAPGAPPAAPGAAKPSKTEAPAKTTGAEKKAAPSQLAPGEKVNINTASKEKLEALPGIGPVKAQAIIDGRPYGTVEDIMKVKGIKEGEFGKIKDMITVK